MSENFYSMKFVLVYKCRVEKCRLHNGHYIWMDHEVKIEWIIQRHMRDLNI